MTLPAKLVRFTFSWVELGLGFDNIVMKHIDQNFLFRDITTQIDGINSFTTNNLESTALTEELCLSGSTMDPPTEPINEERSLDPTIGKHSIKNSFLPVIFT